MSNTKLADSTIIRNQAKLIKEQEAKIVDLEAKLKSVESTKDMYYKLYNDEKAVTDGLNDILDDFNVKRYKDDNHYQSIPLAIRLFAWAMSSHKV